MRRLGRMAALAIGMALAAAVPLTVAGPSQAAAGEALSVDLAASRGASTLVGEGVLYGLNGGVVLNQTMTVSGGAVTVPVTFVNGTKLILWACNGGPDQKWSTRS